MYIRSNPRAVVRTSAAVFCSIALLVQGQPAIANLMAKNYSLTQYVVNNSSQSLMVIDVRVDNGAILSPHVEMIPPHSTAEFTATNSGNGIQMWVSLESDAGNTVDINTNIPKVNPNHTKYSIDNVGPMLTAASVPGDANNTFCMQKGDEAKAILTIGDATTNAPDTKGETIGTTVCQPKIP